MQDYPLALVGVNNFTFTLPRARAKCHKSNQCSDCELTPRHLFIAQFASTHFHDPISRPPFLLFASRVLDTCPIHIAYLLTLAYYRHGILGIGIEPRRCYGRRRMATSSNACSMHHQNPTTWEWNLDNSTTLDAPLSYLEDRKKSTAEGKVETSAL